MSRLIQELPLANGHFDLLFTVDDACHYFGDTVEMLPSLILLVKKGGIAVAIPGLKYEFGGNVPHEMKPFWNGGAARTIHSLAWWKYLWGEAKGIEMVDVGIRGRKVDEHSHKAS